MEMSTGGNEAKNVIIVPPVEQSHIIFDKLSCRVPTGKKGESKLVLQQACGVIRPGRLTALLGPSGAGKTSLLNILAGRRRKGVSGRLHCNLSSEIKRSSKVCLVPQDAALLGALSARETLLIAADLKLSPRTSRQLKNNVMNEIAEMLGIMSVLDTKVCSLSGGEKKRLAVAVELVTDPPIMLLDEPTSGLDSVSSVQVIMRIRQVALAGRAVLVSVHQPASRLFHLFDDALLISEGRSLYVGPVADIVNTFHDAGFVCPNYYNAADFILEVASFEVTDGDINKLANTAQNYVSKYSTGTENIQIINKESIEKDEYEKNGEIPLLYGKDMIEIEQNNLANINDHYQISGWRQFIILLKRSTICNFRDFHLAQMRLVCHIIVGMLLGAVYWKAGNDAAKINSNTSCLFFFLLFLYFSNSMPSVHTIPSEAAVVFKEHLNCWYSIHSYFFSKVLADLPLQFLCATSFILPAYYMTEQPDSYWRVIAVWFICLIFGIQAQTFGLIAGTAFDMALGLFIVPAFNIPMLMFSGFFIKSDEVPSFLCPLPFISNFRYGFEGMMQAIYGYDRPSLNCSKAFCYYKYPSKYLSDMAMDTFSYEIDLLALILWMILMQLCFYLVLRWKVYSVCK